MEAKFKILTYDECKDIVNKSDVFYETIREVEGYKVSIFNYRLANYSDFATLGHLEMRGLTFIHTAGEQICFPMLHKFFNVNENPDYSLEVLKNKKVVRVQDKLDGSMISFLLFPNGKILAKTKLGFDNEQSILANKLLMKNSQLYAFVKDMLFQNMVPIFELTSPFNRIVLHYNDSRLRLIQLRDRLTGDYIIDPFSSKYLEKHRHIERVKSVFYNIQQLNLKKFVEQNKFAEDVEGWVVTFDDGMMAKVKTEWYCERHKIITETLDYPNTIIKLLLEEKLDDILSELDKSDPIRIYIEKQTNLIKGALVKQKFQYDTLIKEYFEVFNCDIQKFAAKYNKSFKDFKIISKAIRGNLHNDDDFLWKELIDKVLYDTRRLNLAVEWLKEKNIYIDKEELTIKD